MSGNYDEKQRVTNSGRPPELPNNAAAPAPIDPATGQHKDYWVLSEEERAKGFVRPVRHTYIHLGPPGPIHPLRDLTLEELERYKDVHYVKFEEYSRDKRNLVTGRFWTQAALDRASKRCGAVTRMGDALAETYARDPKFYGATFCVACGEHFPVNEFIWDDGSQQVLGS